jgi:hypothetical protein
MHQASINRSNTRYASHRFSIAPPSSRPFNILPLLLVLSTYALPSLLALSTYSPRFSPFQHTHPASHPFTIAPTPPFSPFQHTVHHLRLSPFQRVPSLLILAFNTFPLLLTLSTYSRCFSLFKHAHPAFHPSTYMLQTSYQHFLPTISTLHASICFLLFLTNSICFSSFQNIPTASHPFNILPPPCFSRFQHAQLLLTLSTPFTCSSPFQHLSPASRPFNTFHLLLALSTPFTCSSPFQHLSSASLPYNTFHLLLTLLPPFTCFSPFYHLSPASHPFNTFQLLLTLLTSPPRFSRFQHAHLLLTLSTPFNCFSPF